MDISEIEQRIKELNKTKRFIHSLNVRDEAVRMAAFYGADVEKARLAGLVHDCAKDLSEEQMTDFYKKFNLDADKLMSVDEKLRHAKVGAYFAKYEFGIDDDEIFDAIYYHTTGKADMPILTKIIFIADCIEPGRDYKGVEKMRKLAYKDLDSAVLEALDFTFKTLIKKKKIFHPDTIEARNFILRERKK